MADSGKRLPEMVERRSGKEAAERPEWLLEGWTRETTKTKMQTESGIEEEEDVVTINLATIWTPAEYNARLLDTIYSNFIDALPVVKYCSENNRRLIHFSTCDLRGVGKTIGSFLLKDHPLTTGFLQIWQEETIHR